MNVNSSDWVATVAALVLDGFAYLDLLTAIDRLDEIEVVLHLIRPDDHADVFLHTRTPDARLDSLTTVLPAASWHEREIGEMFGVEFAGHPDPRPLLLVAGAASPPLLKGTAVRERIDQPWPGRSGTATEGAGRRSRRTSMPPGVRAEWLQEGE